MQCRDAPSELANTRTSFWASGQHISIGHQQHPKRNRIRARARLISNAGLERGDNLSPQVMRSRAVKVTGGGDCVHNIDSPQGLVQLVAGLVLFHS